MIWFRKLIQTDPGFGNHYGLRLLLEMDDIVSQSSSALYGNMMLYFMFRSHILISFGHGVLGGNELNS